MAILKLPTQESRSSPPRENSYKKRLFEARGKPREEAYKIRIDYFKPGRKPQEEAHETRMAKEQTYQNITNENTKKSKQNTLAGVSNWTSAIGFKNHGKHTCVVSAIMPGNDDDHWALGDFDMKKPKKTYLLAIKERAGRKKKLRRKRRAQEKEYTRRKISTTPSDKFGDGLTRIIFCAQVVVVGSKRSTPQRRASDGKWGRNVARGGSASPGTPWRARGGDALFRASFRG
jgi:hypothetical protein